MTPAPYRTHSQSLGHRLYIPEPGTRFYRRGAGSTGSDDAQRLQQTSITGSLFLDGVAERRELGQETQGVKSF